MVREQLDAIGLGTPYRLAATGLAELLFRVPALEAIFVQASRRLWRAPAIGLAVRSTAYRLAERLRGSGREYRPVQVSGDTLQADVSHWLFTGMYFANVEYEPDTLRYFAAHLSAGGVFVDIGSNAGLMTLFAARRVGPSGRVFAFEPNPPVFAELTAHVERNGMADRVHTFNCALSNVNGRAALHVTPVMSGLASLAPNAAPAADSLRAADAYTVEVRTERFDDWIRDAGLDHVDLVKIDVEGAEDRVLDGMRESLHAGRVARVVCETNVGSVAHQILIAHGYTATLLDSYAVVGNYAYEKPASPNERFGIGN